MSSTESASLADDWRGSPYFKTVVQVLIIVGIIFLLRSMIQLARHVRHKARSDREDTAGGHERTAPEVNATLGTELQEFGGQEMEDTAGAGDIEAALGISLPLPVLSSRGHRRPRAVSASSQRRAGSNEDDHEANNDVDANGASVLPATQPPA